MKTFRKYYFQFVFLLIFMGCEKPYSWDFKPVESEAIVVDGIITNELKEQCIRLSGPNLNLNDTLNPLSGATVVVDDSITRYEFIESPDIPGSYYSEPFQVVIDRKYRLTIESGDRIYEADAEVVPVTAIPDIIVALDDSTNLNRFVYSASSQASMTEVFYDWSHDQAFCQDYGFYNAQETYYTLNNTDVNAVFGPNREIIYFPHETILIRKKYGLTDEHQQFIRSLLMETDWSGGIFDVQHGNVSTNLSNGALGFFAACMVITDTTRID